MMIISPMAATDAAGELPAEEGPDQDACGHEVVALPPGIAVQYEELMDSHREPFVLCTPEGHPWRRSNFRIRFWRPAWDGNELDDPGAGERRRRSCRRSRFTRDGTRMPPG
ncbi:hypothetical protein DV20_37735 [Amycolatopsis rifamycinica]|uniref:Uncharacterized protein n=1 Tax=Amycolatopsis rifamycinica TaxID=287986 RepID=A0A066TPS8_9PSEU|nr:hypothetical protein DV20_37735 [Amycolatopsis rifamycinica]